MAGTEAPRRGGGTDAPRRGAGRDAPRGLGEDLVLDELFDLTLYKKLHETAHGGLAKILGDLIPVETGHLAFWRNFFGIERDRLDLRRRMKLRLLVFACRLLGANAVHLVLEAIEIHGVRKYLRIWETYRDQPLGIAVREILSDEFEHEDAIVSQMSERKIDPERIRSIFLGLNDGLVEILGAVSGFYAAFGHSPLVLIAGSTVAAAGSLSMAAGAYAAASSGNEVQRIESGKARFLGNAETVASQSRPVGTGLLVGVSYLIGATVPVLPVLFGAANILWSIVAAVVVIVLVSVVLSFLSGMRVRQRVFTNLVIMSAAVAVTYTIGLVARRLWGIEV